MPKSGGTILNISSIAAYTGGSRGGAIAYAAAKASLHGLARDLTGRNIRVNAIAPGLIAATEFTGSWPDERLAQTAWFFASSGGSFISGEIINVNGGWLFGR